MQKITVRIETKYGNKHVYPVCETAKMLAELSGQKTLTTKQVDAIKRLGYIIEVEQETL